MADLTLQMEGLNLDAGLTSPASPGSPASSTTALFPPTNATIIDRDGDLYLVVGSEKRAFQVDSRALVCVSSVWKSMLTGNWAESRPVSGAWIVDLPADSPRAIEVLLHIIHLHTRQIPRPGDLDVEDLFHVAVAVDMYDLSGCLGLCAKSWCSEIVPDRLSVESLAQSSWIAWVFGDRNLFQRVLNLLVIKLETDGDGELVDGGSSGLVLGDMEYLKAMDLPDHLAASRNELITSLLAVLQSTLQTAINTSKTANPSPFCRSTVVSALRPDSARYKARADCTVAILGSLIQSLAAEDLFPYPNSPEDISMSASALQQRLARAVEGIETLGVPGGGGKAFMGEEAHAGCNPKKKLLRLLDEALETTRCAPTEAQIRHLDKTAERIGIGESVRGW